VRVAGVVTDEAYRELLRFMVDRGYSTVSRALGAALEEWMGARQGRVLHPVQPRSGTDAAPSADGVPHRSGEVLHPSAGGMGT
jgi:hypothetical protein